ncbi:MAG: aspartate-semialdehyde dehydrogenase [Candidatus Eremiobacteraeota bacterium]|nr:aspartate-semialdehyde dehydrogenase [Candidatus Eremiobacteraeota bacterium]
MNLAVVGATGIVGETLLRVLEERNVNIGRLGAFASRRYDGGVRYRGQAVDVQATSGAALANWDALFFASTQDASTKYAPALARSGSFIIDNSPAFRSDPDVPLLVPEVNAGAFDARQRIFPVANCTAIILCVALGPLQRAAGLQSVRVATYQAVSGAGRAGLQELEAAQRASLQGEPEPQSKVFARPIAQNVVPQIGEIRADGSCAEEIKVCAETRKILDLAGLHIAVTAVRVPVRFVHSAVVFFETQEDATVDQLAAALQNAAGVTYYPQGIVTPREVEGTDQVHIARLRAQNGSRKHFQMWIAGDQLRKGAATNAVQILELLLQRGLLR